jgi:Ti-type conjugative transfer relaxase TraA
LRDLAIYHLSMKPISRASGRSAVAAAAYRAGESLTNERDGLTHDFSRRVGVEHAEIVLPFGVEAVWANDRSALWNAAERSEQRKDARVAREFEIALPNELTAEQRLEAARAFAQSLADRYGAAVDVAVHSPHGETDIRNHHAHLMMTVRSVEPEGLGDKTLMEQENKWLLSRALPTTQLQLREVRQSWEGIANERLAAAGLDIRIDHRSHQERGLEIEPTEHMGVHATHMQRDGMDVSRVRLDAEAARRNGELIRQKPEQVLSLITGEKSVFDRHDIARTLHRYVDEPEAFQTAFATVMASPALVELQSEQPSGQGGIDRRIQSGQARYSTREMVNLERNLADSAMRMREGRGHGVERQHVQAALAGQDAAIRQSVATDSIAKLERGEVSAADRTRQITTAGLSEEQRIAVEHITGGEQIAAVVGFAGAGKSTMLSAARQAWERQGFSVHGAALSGKAAEGLEESSGIASRTLASWDHGWEAGRGELGPKDVLVIDEAGMVGSRQLARIVGETERRGTKLVLVGDHEQLQAIGAGAPFRAIAERTGFAELRDIRRQRDGWQRAASMDFARHRTGEGLGAYAEHGGVSFSQSREGARSQIVRDYMADLQERPDGSRLAMAHRRVDVRALNEEIRTARQEGGDLARGGEAGERSFQTNDGERYFAAGDRIVFLENNRDLGVKNGMLGTVTAVEDGRLEARLDAKGRAGAERTVSMAIADYAAIDHGYATTIHKTQGATVDRSFVLASSTMDRHLTYVAMTRHRDEGRLYAGRDEFTNRHAGRLVEHGKAPYEHDPQNRGSYYVTLQTDAGSKRTIWGVDLERAMLETAPKIGDRIGLEHRGSETVRLPDGRTAERHSWRVRSADELAFRQLKYKLSRDGSKETTLDYAKDFAQRRGIAGQLGVHSEIEVPRQFEPWSPERGGEGAVARQSQAGTTPADLRDRRASHSQGLGSGEDRHSEPSPGKPETQQQRSPIIPEWAPGLREERQAARETVAQAPSVQQPDKKRGLFAGLKLDTGGERSDFSREQGSTGVSKSLGRAGGPDGAARRSDNTDLVRATEAYARSYRDAARMGEMGLPVVEHQKVALHKAGAALDGLRPGSTVELQSALRHDPQTRRVMNEAKGPERATQLLAGMARERQAQQDPTIRAERLVARWNKLEEEHGKLGRWQQREDREKVEAGLRAIAGEIAKDSTVEMALREKQRELGIREDSRLGQAIRQADIGKALERSLDRGERDREQDRSR